MYGKANTKWTFLTQRQVEAAFHILDYDFRFPLNRTDPATSSSLLSGGEAGGRGRQPDELDAEGGCSSLSDNPYIIVRGSVTGLNLTDVRKVPWCLLCPPYSDNHGVFVKAASG